MNYPINKGQITAIHVAKTTANLDEETYRELIHLFTEGRCTTSKQMLYKEAQELLNYFNEINPSEKNKADKMRKKIISHCHSMNWYIEGTRKLDYNRLNDWCKKFGYLHKDLNDYTYKELPALVTQFETVFVSYLKAYNRK